MNPSEADTGTVLEVAFASDQTANPTPSEVAPVAVRLPRLLNLQILRAFAASMVVVEHSIGELTFWHYPMTRYISPSNAAGGSGVIVFFLLSGFIMVRQSRPLFDKKWGSLTFAYERIIRIVPLYWIATVIWYWQVVHGRADVPSHRRQLFYSLLFLPNAVKGNDLLHPILSQGWTLNYEMIFYFILTLCLLLPSRFGIPALVLVIGCVISIVHLLNPFGSGTPALVWSFYTSPVMILFALGAIVGYLEPRIVSLGRISTTVSPAFLIVLPSAILLLLGISENHWWVWSGEAVFGLLLLTLCGFSNPVRVGWINQTLILLGDASYSTYLTHVWAISFVFPIAVKAYAHFHASLEQPAAFIVVCILAANILGLTVHILLERPITRAIRKLNLPFITARRSTAPSAI